jgi:class 3 adenylate cyclase
MVAVGAPSAATDTMRGHENNNYGFRELLSMLADGADDAARKQTEERIWQRYGTKGAAFISDMCSFSRTTRAHGICHFLALIERARRLIAPEILRHGGQLLKFEIDNCFAFFDTVDAALAAARDINARLNETNLRAPEEERITLAIGIDYGELLLIDGRDYFGDPVNTACKLGEDIAAEGETLVTERAMALTSLDMAYVMERKIARISGIEIEYSRIDFFHARGRR